MAAGKITLFDDGRFVGMRTSSTIEQLFCRGLITLERNKKGFLIAAHCVHLPQTPGTDEASSSDQRLFASPTIPPVTRYSYRDATIISKPWELKRLNGTRSGLNYAKGASPADFLGVVGSCLRTTLPAPPELRNNRSMPESLYLQLLYEPNPSSKLTIAKVERCPIFHNIARIALAQAEKRNDPKTARLAQMLELVLPGFREN